MEREVKTLSTGQVAQAILAATDRMWRADNTGTHTRDPLLWEDQKDTAEFGAVNCVPKHWHVYAAPEATSAFWRIVLGQTWHVAPSLPNGEVRHLWPGDLVVEPGDGVDQIREKLEQARRAFIAHAAAAGAGQAPSSAAQE